MGKTLLLAIIASSLGRGLYTHAHSVYVIASRTCTCTCACTWVRATTSQAQQGLMLGSAAQSHSARHRPIAQIRQSGGAQGHKATWHMRPYDVCSRKCAFLCMYMCMHAFICVHECMHRGAPGKATLCMCVYIWATLLQHCPLSQCHAPSSVASRRT